MNTEQWRFAAGLAITALALLVEHYYFRGDNISRVKAYALGTATIWVGLAIWLFPSSTFWMSLAFPAMAGAVVYWAYRDDELRNARLRDLLATLPPSDD